MLSSCLGVFICIDVILLLLCGVGCEDIFVVVCCVKDSFGGVGGGIVVTGVTVGFIVVGVVVECVFIVLIVFVYEGGVVVVVGVIVVCCGGGVFGIGGVIGVAGVVASTFVEVGVASNVVVLFEVVLDLKLLFLVENDDMFLNLLNLLFKLSFNLRFNLSFGSRFSFKSSSSFASFIFVSVICGFGNGCVFLFNCMFMYCSFGSSVCCFVRDLDNYVVNFAAFVFANRFSVISC